jgi:hypothetical protein
MRLDAVNILTQLTLIVLLWVAVTSGIIVAYLLSSHAVLWAVLIMGTDTEMQRTVARMCLVVCAAVVLLSIVHYTSCMGSAVDCLAYIYVSINSIVLTAAIAIIDITYAIEAPQVPDALPLPSAPPAPAPSADVVPSAQPKSQMPLRQRRRQKSS